MDGRENWIWYGNHEGKGLKPGMYMALMGGFESEEEAQEELDKGFGGSHGPVMGPLEFVHSVYVSNIFIRFVNRADAEKFAPGFGRKLGDTGTTLDVWYEKDLIWFDGSRYSDYTVFYYKGDGHGEDEETA